MEFNMRKDFFLIRHGESLGNIGMDSSADPSLSPNGHAQVAKCALFMKKYLNADDIILTSPFERCIVTASCIARESGAELVLEPALHEYFAPSLVNMKYLKLDTLKQKQQKYPELNWPHYENIEDIWWPSKAEKYEDRTIRIAMLRNRLIDENFKYSKIVCVGHWCSIKDLASLLVPEFKMDFVKNAAVTNISFENGIFNIEFFNKTV
jgi:broad specificity phosphatase PhoE